MRAITNRKRVTEDGVVEYTMKRVVGGTHFGFSLQFYPAMIALPEYRGIAAQRLVRARQVLREKIEMKTKEQAP